jgi:uncharacterized delta-60 repeat protein
MWVVGYDGPVGREDRPYAIAVDESGNIYVTGESTDSNNYLDYVTIKYDSDGTELWAARYNGMAGSDDHARAIALDQSGNVYVTGYSVGTNLSYNYATLKYDPDGNLLWVATYDGPVGEDDRARAIALDQSGNVYVTGDSVGTDVFTDYATIKYDTDGNKLWVARYNGPRSYDYASAIAVDTGGNVYVTGYSKGVSNYYDYATVKYDTDGNELWVSRYDGPATRDDSARAIALDQSGNVYVTGESDGTGSEDYATIKCKGTNGKILWKKRYDGPAASSDHARAIALDQSGNVYVTGYSTGDSTDYATVIYTSGGAEVWVARYDGPGMGSDYAEAIAMDGNGGIYITGQSLGEGTDVDYATIKYIPTWIRIKKAWTTDLSNVKKTTFLPGDGIRYRIRFMFNGDLDKIYRIRATVNVGGAFTDILKRLKKCTPGTYLFAKIDDTVPLDANPGQATVKFNVILRELGVPDILDTHRVKRTITVTQSP